MNTGVAAPLLAERDPDEPEQFLDFRGMLVAALKVWWLVLLACLIGGASAYLYFRDKPLMYISTGIIEIEDQKNVQLPNKADGDNDLKNPEVLETIVRAFSHRALMERVCDSMNLTNDRRFLGPNSPFPATRDSVVETLLRLAGAKLQRGSRLVDVSFVHEDPAVAKSIVKVLIEQFREQEMDQRLKALEREHGIWTEKRDILEKKLKESERKKQQYNEDAGSVSVEDERRIADDNLRALNREWSAVRSDLVQMEANADLLKKAGKDPAVLMTITIIAQDPEVVREREKLSSLEAQVAALTQRYREKYPALIEAKAQLASAQDNLTRLIVGTPARLEMRHKTAEARAAILEEAVSKQAKALLEVDKRTIRFRELQREYESDQTLFHAVLQREKESNAALNTNFVRFNLVEPAMAATPLRNRRLLAILGSAFGAGALVAITAAALFLLNTTLRTVDEAERILNLPVFAAVPQFQGAKDAAALVRNPGEAVAESFRTLRTALSLLNGPPRVLFFTSAVSGEGKSFSAAQAAIAFARQGLRSLLVECDLRCPTIHTLILNKQVSPPGVADYLARKPTSVYPTNIENLWVLPAGSPTKNPAELLSGPRFAKMINSMKEGFDRVVVDSAPLNVVSDTLSTIACAEAICLVVRCNVTARKVVFRAIELLRRAGAKPDGVILNGISDSKLFSNYYHYSADYYAPRSVEGSPPKPRPTNSNLPQESRTPAAKPPVESKL